MGVINTVAFLWNALQTWQMWGRKPDSLCIPTLTFHKWAAYIQPVKFSNSFLPLKYLNALRPSLIVPLMPVGHTRHYESREWIWHQWGACIWWHIRFLSLNSRTWIKIIKNVECQSHVQSSVDSPLAWKMAGRLRDLGIPFPNWYVQLSRHQLEATWCTVIEGKERQSQLLN